MIHYEEAEYKEGQEVKIIGESSAIAKNCTKAGIDISSIKTTSLSAKEIQEIQISGYPNDLIFITMQFLGGIKEYPEVYSDKFLNINPEIKENILYEIKQEIFQEKFSQFFDEKTIQNVLQNQDKIHSAIDLITLFNDEFAKSPMTAEKLEKIVLNTYKAKNDLNDFAEHLSSKYGIDKKSAQKIFQSLDRVYNGKEMSFMQDLSEMKKIGSGDKLHSSGTKIANIFRNNEKITPQSAKQTFQNEMFKVIKFLQENTQENDINLQLMQGQLITDDLPNEKKINQIENLKKIFENNEDQEVEKNKQISSQPLTRENVETIVFNSYKKSSDVKEFCDNLKAALPEIKTKAEQYNKFTQQFPEKINKIMNIKSDTLKFMAKHSHNQINKNMENIFHAIKLVYGEKNIDLIQTPAEMHRSGKREKLHSIATNLANKMRTTEKVSVKIAKENYHEALDKLCMSLGIKVIQQKGQNLA